jgi:glutamine synthetase
MTLDEDPAARPADSPRDNAGNALSLDRLREQIDSHVVETVELVLVDMQGRLQGKRVSAQHFLDVVLDRGCEAQSYLLATDVEMNTLSGYDIASWETGYGNLVMRPDMSTLRRIPWHPSSVLVFADMVGPDGSQVAVSPRQMLRHQTSRLADRNWRALAGTELEFQAFRDTYGDAWRDGYNNLHPVSDYCGDYSMLDTRGNGNLLAELTRDLSTACVDLETIVTEAALGQHEIVLACREAMITADNHALAKFATKHVAARLDQSVTFMAKLGADAGNACHVHFSLRGLDDDEPVFAGSSAHGFSPVMENFLAGQLAYLPELTFLLAPNVNSYKRFVDGSYAPTAISWGYDNRTCALRVVGQGKSLRLEHRLAGADVNPHLALAAIIAAGLHGVQNNLELAPPTPGNAYMSDLPRVPTTLRDAVALFKDSSVAAKAFGEDVVRHYTRMGEIEIEQFDQAVTDWEKRRGFERL